MTLDPFIQTRRQFLASSSSLGLGAMALGSMHPNSTDLALPHFPAKAKRVIYLFQSGGPSQHDLFDYKPKLNELNGEQLPDSVRKGQRLTGMSGNQSSLPLAGSLFTFKQHGACGAWVSDLMPHTSKIVDDLCFIRSLHTEAINHDPAITFFQTGAEQAGRPAFGAWVNYGLGSMNSNLPSFVVLVTANKSGQPLYARLWGSAFLDAQHQGVQFRAGDSPVLYLTNPEGVSAPSRRRMLDSLRSLNMLSFKQEQDPSITARVAQYELAHRMQMSVPEATDFSTEGDDVFELYGEAARTPGTYAANCLLARRLAERDVRFIQLYHQGWDQHDNLPGAIRTQALETDQASAALITDLKRRGMLEDTLVVWGGEFGRTNYSQGALTATNYGRDHHPRCFTMWMAGGGIKGGTTYGTTDELGYNIETNPVHVHDLQATILHQLGIDHKRLTYHHQGRDVRLTDVSGHVIKDLLV